MRLQEKKSPSAEKAVSERKTERPVSEQVKRSLARKRIRWVAGIFGTVLLMAGIMFGVWALTAPTEERSSAYTSIDAAEESRLFYEQALKALESDDTSAAVEFLEKAVALNPLNTSARTRLDSLKQAEGDPTIGSDENPSSGESDSSGSIDPDEGFTDPVSDLALLLPDEVDSYDMGLPFVTEKEGQIVADAIMRSDTGAKIRKATFYVYDFDDTASAESFVS